MKMKVLVVGPLPPPFYGVSVATKLILNSSLKKEFELFHLDTSDHREKINFNKLDVMNAYLALKHIYMLGRLIIKHHPDVVYIPICHGFWGYLRDAILIFTAALGKARIILHLRGAGFKEFYQNSMFFFRWLIRKSFARLDRMIVLGENLRGLFDGLISPEKLRVVPNGVDIKNFSMSKAARRTNEEVRILFISNFQRTKGYREILRAIKILASKYRVVGIFAGKWRDEKEKRETFAYIEKNSLHNVVKFIGSVNENEKVKLLASSDIFVLPTYYKIEGQPWVVLEAMASGLPVIATDQGCIAETIVDNETGYIVPKHNVPIIVRKIERLILDSELRVLMGVRGRERIATVFSEKNFISRLGAVFSELGKHERLNRKK